MPFSAAVAVGDETVFVKDKQCVRAYRKRHDGWSAAKATQVAARGDTVLLSAVRDRLSVYRASPPGWVLIEELQRENPAHEARFGSSSMALSQSYIFVSGEEASGSEFVGNNGVVYVYSR